jgi:hypothetical protein
MGVVFEKLEDLIYDFLPGTVHKYRNWEGEVNLGELMIG